MNCGLCKQPIRGDESYVTDHYTCSADLAQSFRDDIAKLEQAAMKNISGADHVTYAAMEEELARLRAAIALLANCVGAHIISQDNARRIEELLRPPYQRTQP